MHGDDIGTLRARLGILTGLISETPVKPAPFFSTVAARKHVEGTASAVKPEFVELLYVHVRVLVQTMMVEMMSDPVIVSDNDNSCERDLRVRIYERDHENSAVFFCVIAVFLLC